MVTIKAHLIIPAYIYILYTYIKIKQINKIVYRTDANALPSVSPGD
jgi:hypothetical protein